MFRQLLPLTLLALAFEFSFADNAKRQQAQVITSCRNSNQVAVTFDDGPYHFSRDISDAFSSRGARTTFFYNGNNFGCIYSDENIGNIRYAYSKGHQVASHTWAHKDLTTLSDDQINSEMQRVEEALIRIVGASPAFMRPPFGNQNDDVRRVAGQRGQTIALWDFDSGDSTGSTPAQSKGAYDDIIRRHPKNILALNHETDESTAHDVITYAIDKLQAAGYELVTVAECLGMEPYQFTRAPGNKDGSWTC